MAQRKNAAAVALGRKGGKKGGPARAASLTAEQRSESARNAVLARWAKAKNGSGKEPKTTAVDASKEALRRCLNRLQRANSDVEIRRLTEELQRIVFHKQYRNAEN